MTDLPTPDQAGQPAGPRPLGEFFDPFDAGPYGLFPITGGWRGGLVRFGQRGTFDLAFHHLTEDQAPRLWEAARAIGILTLALPTPSANIQPYVRRLYLCYRRAHDAGRRATHEECAKEADNISEATSRKRLQRAGENWEQLTAWWDKMHAEMSQ